MSIEEYSLQTGTTVALILILAVLLIYSALKKKKSGDSPKAAHENKSTKNRFVNKKIAWGAATIILILLAYFFGVKTVQWEMSKKHSQDQEIPNQFLLSECLKNAEKLDDNPYSKIVINNCYEQYYQK